MNFSLALRHLKSGNQIQRSGWNGKNMYLFLVSEWTITGSPAANIPVIPYHPFIVMKTADNKLVPWLANQSDILAEDWVVV